MHYKEIQTYDLYSFAKALEEAVKDGYQVLDETIYSLKLLVLLFWQQLVRNRPKKP